MTLTLKSSNRRTILKATAWGAPVVALASAAPAASASPATSDMLGSSMMMNTPNDTLILVFAQGVYGYNLGGSDITLSNVSVTVWLPGANNTAFLSDAGGQSAGDPNWSDPVATGQTMVIDGVTLYGYSTTYQGASSTAATIVMTAPLQLSTTTPYSQYPANSPIGLSITGIVNGVVKNEFNSGTVVDNQYVNINPIS